MKKKGDDNIKKWINENMKSRSCLVVLVGEHTASRKWVQYEIEHAWNSGKGIVGIYIHNLKDKNGNTTTKGDNPFNFTIGGRNLSRIVHCYDPSTYNAYSDIKNNISDWVEEAISNRKLY
ncbi:MAG: TIR domain-containing protein [Campylobacteraceae bacterium]|nr:TIR domain-containing protein [Campylobacteraceae bacterium]